MLAFGLGRLAKERGVSQRQLAKKLGYKQAVVLSHMATGRAPIPLDRAGELAEALDLDKQRFLFAVLDQRHPEIQWRELLHRNAGEASATVLELEAIAARPLDTLNDEQLRVMREVVADPKPSRRWLSIQEISIMNAVRRLRPKVETVGLTRGEIADIERALDENPS